MNSWQALMPPKTRCKQLWWLWRRSKGKELITTGTTLQSEGRRLQVRAHTGIVWRAETTDDLLPGQSLQLSQPKLQDTHSILLLTQVKLQTVWLVNRMNPKWHSKFQIWGSASSSLWATRSLLHFLQTTMSGKSPKKHLLSSWADLKFHEPPQKEKAEAEEVIKTCLSSSNYRRKL